MGLLDMATKVALNKLKDGTINPKLEGIAVVDEISYKDKKLFLRCSLEGFPSQPIEVTCEDIKLSPDGASASVGKFTSNTAFVQNALDRYVAGKDFGIPEGAPRLAAIAAKKVLGL